MQKNSYDQKRISDLDSLRYFLHTLKITLNIHRQRTLLNTLLITYAPQNQDIHFSNFIYFSPQCEKARVDFL